MKQENYELLKEHYATALYTAVNLDYMRNINNGKKADFERIYKEEGYTDRINWSCNGCVMNAFKRLGKLYFKAEEQYTKQEEIIEPEALKVVLEAPIEEDATVVLEEPKVVEELKQTTDQLKKDIKLVKVTKKVNKTKK